jgi:hypothetical protein
MRIEELSVDDEADEADDKSDTCRDRRTWGYLCMLLLLFVQRYKSLCGHCRNNQAAL